MRQARARNKRNQMSGICISVFILRCLHSGVCIQKMLRRQLGVRQQPGAKIDHDLTNEKMEKTMDHKQSMVFLLPRTG